MDVCTRTGCWAAEPGLWWCSTLGPRSTFPITASAPWEETLSCMAAGTAHIQLFCSFHGSTISSNLVCVGGAGQRRWDSRTARARYPWEHHVCWKRSPRFFLSKLVAHVLLLLLANQIIYFPHSLKKPCFEPIHSGDLYTFSSRFSSKLLVH